MIVKLRRLIVCSSTIFYNLPQSPPENVTAVAGSDVSFHCTTPLEIRPFISWVKIVEDEFLLLGEHTEVLRLDNVTFADAGEVMEEIHHCLKCSAVSSEAYTIFRIY